MMMWPLPDDGSFSSPWRRFPATDDPDVRLTYEVAGRLLADDRTRHQRVTVEVQNRVVLLTGTVDTAATRQVVSDIAHHTGGVADVCNGLRVAKPGEGLNLANSPRFELDGGGRSSELADDRRFQAMIVAMQAQDPTWTGRIAEPVRRSSALMWAILAGFTWALMSILMVRFGWAGVAVSCVVAGPVLGLARRRRRLAPATERTDHPAP